MAIKKVVPGSLTEAYKLRQGDFAPSLVGNQFTDPNAFFTLGNFAITRNFQGRIAKDFKLGEWSEYYNLDNLQITEEEMDTLVSENLTVRLNFDTTNLERYVYFGNFSKFLESEIEDVILKWPASLHVSPNPIEPTTTRPTNINTVLDFIYDVETDLSTFKSPKLAFNNPYTLDYSDNIFNPNNITSQISSYVLSNGLGNEYVIESMTGYSVNDNYVYFVIKGNPFESLTSTFGKPIFHIKPIKKIRNDFFINLTDFQKILLNRLTIPQYTFIVDVPIKYEDGTIGFSKKSLTWPTTDGYNLDINTIAYSNYIEEFFYVASLFDRNKTDLVVRRLVSDSIVEYDTEGEGNEQTGMRVSKLLRIYGVEFDVVKKYINGISFANVVTYNKKDNTSDDLIKIMAKTLGFDVLLMNSTGFDLTGINNQGDSPQFEGYSRELSPKEIDIELWRRLVINAWWLFRSKGTRKVLEFFMNLFKINGCLISMDEIIYLAKDKLDLLKTRQQFNRLLGSDFFDLNFNSLPFDEFGFPKTPTNTTTFWFQNDGFWYNGGNESVLGNNPHFGPYDYGQRYWDRFRCFIDSFNPVTEITNTVVNVTNYFSDFNEGTFEYDEDGGSSLVSYGGEIPDFLTNNPNVVAAGTVLYGETDGPKTIIDSEDLYAFRITFNGGDTFCGDCPTESGFGGDGLVYVTGPSGKSEPLNIEECCEFYWLPQENIEPTPPEPVVGDTIVVGEVAAKKQILPELGLSPGPGLLPNLETPQYYCWWCPPQSSIKIVCDSMDFINTLNLSEEDIVNIAVQFGYQNDSYVENYNFVMNLLNTFFGGGNCVYTVGNKILKNKNCCESRGGEWDQELKLCKTNRGIPKCPKDGIGFIYGLVGRPIESNEPITETNFNMLSELCCNQLGYNYGLTGIRLYNIDGSITTTPNQEAIDLLLDINPNNPRFGCFECTNEYKETIINVDNIGETIIITELNNTMVSEKCCSYAGFNYGEVSINGVITGVCIKCTPNVSVNIETNTVTKIDGSELNQYCCVENGYYYYNGDPKNVKGCYYCPPLADGAYTIVSSTVSGFGYDIILDGNNNKLSQQCCMYYKNVSGNNNVVYDNNIGCFFLT